MNALLCIALCMAPGTVQDSRDKARTLPLIQATALAPPPPSVHRIAARGAAPMTQEQETAARDSMRRGLDWLRRHTHEEGGWLADLRASPTDTTTAQRSPVGAAVTALGLKAFIQAGGDPDADPMLRRIITDLITRQQADGRFDTGSLSTYVTATIVAALATVPDDDAIKASVHRGADALRALQWSEDDRVPPTLDWYGGAGYGSHGRPDLSSTQWLLEGLQAAGDCSGSGHVLGCDCDNDPARSRAIAFLTRCQNTAANGADWAGTDGGFVYTAAGGGESMASQAAGEGRYGETMPPGEARSLRSYGSMTYAGYKSLLFAGLPRDDPRVTAALDWIRAHWTMDTNPGLGRQGWYYYLHGLARAMAAGGHGTITDVDGTPHDWRSELVETLIDSQRVDGSWINEETRWLEGHPELATIYAVLALQEALKPSS